MPKSKYKKRADGRYATSIQVGYKDNGKPNLKFVYARTIAEMDRKVAEVKRLRDNGIVIDDRSLTVGDWADQWYDIYRSSREAATREMYQLQINKHIKPNIGQIQLKKLRTHHIQKVITDMEKRGLTRTITNFVMTIRAMIQQAIANDLIIKDVTEQLDIPDIPDSKNRALTKLEKTALSKVDFTLKQKAFVNTIRYCGLRRGEMLGLMKTDINLKSKSIRIDRAVGFENRKPYIKAPKWDSYRTVDIPEVLVPILRDYMKTVDGVYLFTKQDGSLHTTDSYKRFWETIVKRVNIAAGGKPKKNGRPKQGEPAGAGELIVIHGLTAHVFRHEYATMLYYADIDILDAARLMGHRNAKTTLKIYTHLDKEKSDSLNKLNEHIAKLV